MHEYAESKVYDLLFKDGSVTKKFAADSIRPRRWDRSMCDIKTKRIGVPIILNGYRNRYSQSQIEGKHKSFICTDINSPESLRMHNLQHDYDACANGTARGYKGQSPTAPSRGAAASLGRRGGVSSFAYSNVID